VTSIKPHHQYHQAASPSRITEYHRYHQYHQAASPICNPLLFYTPTAVNLSLTRTTVKNTMIVKRCQPDNTLHQPSSRWKLNRAICAAPYSNNQFQLSIIAISSTCMQ